MESFSTKNAFNYYVHLISFGSDHEQGNKEKNHAMLEGNVEMIVILVHYIRRNGPQDLEMKEKIHVA